MRLQKYIAKAGICSRRKAEQMILDGRVSVNDTLITDMGYKVDISKDKVKVNNQLITLDNDKVYIALNKPSGVITSVKDEKNRKTVLNFTKDIKQRIYPVGRLDYDTSGLIILTNDGDIANKLMHPSKKVYKKYIAMVDGIPSELELDKLRNGIVIDNKKTAKARAYIIDKINEDAVVVIEIYEGRNHQVKKMCEKIGHPVKRLKRVSIGEIELGDLRPGEWRYLTEKELKFLNQL
ncbi:rRNA pseudouridine synthase [Soehngenia saccharolytica]|nr:rRNA pseudouridine synthase [Soehngenia saccharolytica]